MEERLRAYAELVRQWSRRVNLVAPQDLERFEERHVRDCLRPLPLLRTLPAGMGADVGSGAGLPGIPLAIAAPERPWRLIERRRSRVGFLEEAVRVLELPCEVLAISAEEAARDARLREGHVVALARALAPAARAFELLDPLVATGGVSGVFFGPSARLPAEAEVWQEGIAIIRRGRRTHEGVDDRDAGPH